MDFTLSDEQRHIQDTIRDFGEREVKPHAARWNEAEEFPHKAVQRLGALFTPGATTRDIVEWIETHIRPRTS